MYLFELTLFFFIILALFQRSSIVNSDFENIEILNGLDVEKFSGLFRKYYEPLYFFAGRFVKDPPTAESIVQDVFVNLWDHRETLSINTSAKAYLYTSVKNACITFVKRENFFSSMEEDSEHRDNSGKTPDAELEETEIQSAVQNAINKLPEKCRQIFIMCKYDNLSYNEIAEIQNISINTVKTQLKRAVKTLSRNLAHLRSIVIFIQFLVWWYIGK